MSQCKQIEELIIKRSIASLTDKDEEMIENHLLSCAACTAFASKIENITVCENDMVVSPQRNIKRRLMKKMHKRVKQQKTSIVNRIVDIFTFQPAIYKVAAAAILLFLLVLSIPQLDQPQNISNSEYRTAMVDTVSLNVINLNQIIQIVDSQKVGVNLSEDTVLTKILYTL